MREKIGSFIQFIAVIVSFTLMLLGICGAYQIYFGSQDIPMAKIIADSVLKLIMALIGAGVGIGGVLIGNILKR